MIPPPLNINLTFKYKKKNIKEFDRIFNKIGVIAKKLTFLFYNVMTFW